MNIAEMTRQEVNEAVARRKGSIIDSRNYAGDISAAWKLAEGMIFFEIKWTGLLWRASKRIQVGDGHYEWIHADDKEAAMAICKVYLMEHVNT